MPRDGPERVQLGRLLAYVAQDLDARGYPRVGGSRGWRAVTRPQAGQRANSGTERIGGRAIGTVLDGTSGLKTAVSPYCCMAHITYWNLYGP